ncbi:MAG: EF-P lysine aminoacylase GenX [Thermoguttaceae bacterium]|nr:EF-P lysine aminoacylase GenX [Thermoguttaceae bacterium]MBR4102448.1 EF-P lysine aminoacylase GenX [Thermoguttaceae bacterium]
MEEISGMEEMEKMKEAEEAERTGAISEAWRPTAPLENLRRRALLYRTIRAFFDGLDFIETTTPFLSRDTVVDRFVEPISVRVPFCWSEKDGLSERRFRDSETARREATTFYLQTSPEFAMKRLIAAGMNAIYQLAPACRRGDRGAWHNVEFTMLEWYRRGDDYRAGRRLLAELALGVAKQFFAETGLEPKRWAQKPVVERTFADVFEEKTGINPHWATCGDLRDFADRAKIAYPESYLGEESGAFADNGKNGGNSKTGGNGATKDDWLDLIFAEVVQPELGFGAATVVYDYPASQSQLAKTRQEFDCERKKAFGVTERFELFVEGIELANGYHELLDASVLRARIETTSEERRRDGSSELPRESRLLQAMEAGLPACSGCALGVDRFFAVLIGAKSLDETLAFPIEIA